MSFSIGWVQLNRSLEFQLRSGPVPIIVEFHKCQRSVRLGECVINSERLYRRLLGLWHSFARSDGTDWEDQGRVRVGQPCIGQRVCWISGDRLLKVVNPSLCILLCSLV